MTGDEVDLSGVRRHYERVRAEHGETAAGVDFTDVESQQVRFRRLDRLTLEHGVASVCDLGCGYGAYLEHLRVAGYQGSYTGIDLVEHPHDATTGTFEVGAMPVPADAVVASGIFTVRADIGDDDWLAYVDRTVDAMWDAARIGIAFNLLSAASAPARRSAHLWYADPAAVLEGLRRLEAGRVTLDEDHGTFELTLIVLRAG